MTRFQWGAAQGMAIIVVMAMLATTGLLACRDTNCSRVTEAGTDASTGDAKGPATDGAVGDASVSASVMALVSAVDQARYEQDLRAIAKEPRPTWSPNWQAVQQLCADRFNQAGYAVWKQDFGNGTNVLGKRAGTSRPEEQIIVSAHYDSVPDCPGADDNGSGVAGLLEVARVLASREHERTLVLACWDQEEASLLGSLAYAARASERGEQIELVYVFDMIGYHSDQRDSQTIPPELELLYPKEVSAFKKAGSRADFIALLLDDAARSLAGQVAFSHVAAAIDLKVVALPVPAKLKNAELLNALRRSDHAAFWAHDVPAMAISDTGELRNAAYHCRSGQDTVNQLDDAFATKVIQATVGSVATMLAAP